MTSQVAVREFNEHPKNASENAMTMLIVVAIINAVTLAALRYAQRPKTNASFSHQHLHLVKPSQIDQQNYRMYLRKTLDPSQGKETLLHFVASQQASHRLQLAGKKEASR